MAANDKKAAAAKAKAAATGEELLEAIEPIRHDGKDVAPGEPFSADPDSAAALRASGAARGAA